METHARSIAKAISYRITGLILTMLVAWLLTRSLHMAAGIGAVDTVVKLMAFYLHERAWLKVKFGLEPAIADAQVQTALVEEAA